MNPTAFIEARTVLAHARPLLYAQPGALGRPVPKNQPSKMIPTRKGERGEKERKTSRLEGRLKKQKPGAAMELAFSNSCHFTSLLTIRSFVSLAAVPS